MYCYLAMCLLPSTMSCTAVPHRTAPRGARCPLPCPGHPIILRPTATAHRTFSPPRHGTWYIHTPWPRPTSYVRISPLHPQPGLTTAASSRPGQLIGHLPGRSDPIHPLPTAPAPPPSFTLATQILPALSPHRRSWSHRRGHAASEQLVSMSASLRRTAPSRHPSPPMAPIQPYPAMHPPYRNSPREGLSNLPLSLPPLRTLSTTPPTPSDRSSSNGTCFGVHSILNPSREGDEHQHQQRGRRRSASHIESPSPGPGQHSHSQSSVSRPTSVDSTQEYSSASRPFYPPGGPPKRHLLSPKSPRLHGSQSHGLLKAPTGTIDAHQSPFLTANTRPSDPKILQPALHTPPTATRPPYLPTIPPTAPAPPGGSLRTEQQQHHHHRSSSNFLQSGSASPITQHSSYSQTASITSSQYESQRSIGHHAQVHSTRNSSIPMETERNSMIPMAPSSQSSIQLMTIKSHHGHPVQIPVDVQAASKVADEKRRRNAGASARFRARRKEKEREASISISRLEQQLRDAAEDADFYRRERDYFKSIVLQQPHLERHYARPPSPRLRRISIAPSLAPSSTDGLGSDASYGDYEEEEAYEEERNVRRRTNHYRPPTGPPPSEAIPTGTPSVPPNPVHALSPAPPYAPQQHRALSNPQQGLSEHTCRDSYTSKPGRYEERHWVAAQSQAG